MTAEDYSVIAKVLAVEWRNVISYLPPALRGWLIPPAFAFNATMQEWGRWCGHPVNTLELSTRLVEEHPWYAVMEVFRHEIAHQVTQVCYPQEACSEPPHGKRFQMVCEILNANPSASGDFPPLDQRVFGEQNESSTISKLKKLLALSKSANQHEAESALLKARELAEKYQVSLHNGEIADTSEFCSVGVGVPVCRRSIVDSILGTLLNNHYQVMTIWVPVPILSKRCTGYQLYVHGRSSAVRIASYVHAWLTRYINEQRKSQKGNGRFAGRDYAIGILEGFSEVLEARKTAPGAPEEQALIRTCNLELQDSFRRAFPRIRNSYLNQGGCDREAMENGKQKGRNIVIPSGVESGNNSNHKLLR